MANEAGLDRKRVRSDEELLVRRNYRDLFGESMQKIIAEAEGTPDILYGGWAEELRRFYYFLNIRTDKEIIQQDVEDIFSRQFFYYVDIRSGKNKQTKYQKTLIENALRMMYLGSIKLENSSAIPITLSKDSGISQVVQLVVGMIQMNKMVIETESNCEISNRKFKLVLRIRSEDVRFEINLPMLDYFEELKNGIIATNIDPQLSHGIDSLKAKLAEYAQREAEEDELELIILGKKDYDLLKISVDNGVLHLL